TPPATGRAAPPRACAASSYAIRQRAGRAPAPAPAASRRRVWRYAPRRDAALPLGLVAQPAPAVPASARAVLRSPHAPPPTARSRRTPAVREDRTPHRSRSARHRSTPATVRAARGLPATLGRRRPTRAAPLR